MKLLTRKEAQVGLNKENETLTENNIQLRQLEKQVIDRLNNAKANYDPEKLKALKDFEQFVVEINEKKSKLLQEVSAYEKLIEERKDTYYGLIEKQDALEDKVREVQEANRKLDLRETFVLDLEKRIRDKQI